MTTSCVAILGLKAARAASTARCSTNLNGVRVVALCDPDIDRQGRKPRTGSRNGATKWRCTPDLRKVLDRDDDRRGGRRHRQPLARAGHYLGLRGRQGCLCRETRFLERLGRPANGGRGPEIHSASPVQAGTRAAFRDRPAGQPDRFHSFGRTRQSATGARIDLEDLASPSRNARRRACRWRTSTTTCGAVPRRWRRWKRQNNSTTDWHWIWRTGNGDTGNLGVHQFDVCRWFCGYDWLPRRVLSVGGRFTWETTPARRRYTQSARRFRLNADAPILLLAVRTSAGPARLDADGSDPRHPRLQHRAACVAR